MNCPTIIVLAVVVAVFAAIIVSAVRNKRKGKALCSCGGACGCCGGGCSGCHMSGSCHH